MLCITSREADFLPSSICVINGTEIPDFSARNCCVHPNSFLIFRMLFPNTKRISVIKIIILLIATSENNPKAIWNIAVSNYKC